MDSKIVLKPLNPPGNATGNAILETFQHLINGQSTPASAIKAIDALMFEEHDRVQQAADNSADEPDHDLLNRKNFVFDLLPKIAVQVPADHPGQDRLVEFLQNVPQLPHREITNRMGEKVNLWAEGIMEEFEEKHLAFWEPRLFGFIWKWQCLGGHYGHLAEGPEPSLENFSAFSARLFVAGLNIHTGWAIDRSPFKTINHSKALPDDYDPHACAAAQWIIYAAPELFEMCEKDAGYNKSTWEGWRTKFKAIAASQNLSDHCRQTAERALQRMAQTEEAGVTTTNIFYHYGVFFRAGMHVRTQRAERRKFVGDEDQTQ